MQDLIFTGTDDGDFGLLGFCAMYWVIRFQRNVVSSFRGVWSPRSMKYPDLLI